MNSFGADSRFGRDSAHGKFESWLERISVDHPREEVSYRLFRVSDREFEVRIRVLGSRTTDGATLDAYFSAIYRRK
jgi:hypothetical protein